MIEEASARSAFGMRLFFLSFLIENLLLQPRDG